MKEIKNGMIYDTDEAEKICKYSNGLSKRDFRNVTEKLFKTDKGNYFIHGTGGPKTKYAQHNGGTVSGSQEIKPLSKDEVLEWAEKRSVEIEPIEDEFKEELEQA